MDRYQEEPEQMEMDLGDFEVSRGEFFAHSREPLLTLCDGKVSVNTACVRKMSGAEYIQILVNRKTHKLALRACEEDDLFSLRWVKEKDGKRMPRQITGKIFFMKICAMMNWSGEERYRMLGKFVRANGDLLFLFDLDVVGTFPRVTREDGKKVRSRTPVFPAELLHVFGPLYSEHKKELGINLHQGFAVLSVKDGELHPRESGDRKEGMTDAGNDGGAGENGHRPEEEPPENP